VRTANRHHAVVELIDLPVCEPNVSDAIVLVSTAAGFRMAFVAFDTWDPDRPDQPRGVALVRFDRIRQVIARGPNDEALHRHPFFSLGLRHYTLQEIVHSPWNALVSSLLDKDGRVNRCEDARHFVLAFKETCVDVLADGYALIGIFPSQDTALSAARAN
jgi:hypothetical protein